MDEPTSDSLDGAVRVTAIGGSFREGSCTRTASMEALEEAERGGAVIELIDLRVPDLAIYDADFDPAEAGDTTEPTARVRDAAGVSRSSGTRHRAGWTAVGSGTVDRERSSFDIVEPAQRVGETRYVKGYAHG